MLRAGEVLAAVQQLLLDGVRQPQEVVRMAALQWALKLFPFRDVPARYVCVLAAADSRYVPGGYSQKVDFQLSNVSETLAGVVVEWRRGVLRGRK